MKTPSTDLFQLIRSLTQAERRYLKVQAGNPESDYIRLLDAIAGMETYDEKALKKQFAGHAIGRHFAVSKQYLQQFILKSLSRFDQHNPDIQADKQLSQARILYEKKLYGQCYQLLQRLRKTAARHELYELQLHILQLEKQLLSSPFAAHSGHLQPDRLYEEEKSCLACIANINEYWQLQQHTYRLQKQIQSARDPQQEQELGELLSHPLLQHIDLAITLQSKLYFLQARATAYFTLGDAAEAYQINTQALRLLEQNKDYVERYPERYLSTLNNYLIDSLVLKQYEALAEGLPKLAALPASEPFRSISNIEARIFRQRFQLEINWYLAIGDFDRGLRLIPLLEAGLKEYAPFLPKQNVVTFHYLAAYLLFGSRHYSESLHWINLILQDTREEVVQEIYHFTRLLNLLVHFELQHYTLLDSLIPATRRYWRTHGKIYAVETLLLKYLQQVMYAPSRREEQSLTDAFLKSLQSLRAAPSENRVFNYIDLERWILLRNAAEN